MSGLDFSELTDDQLVELASALAHEALLRNPAVAAAFQQALLTEKERADAAMRGARMGKARQAQAIEDVHRRAAEEQSREELRQRKHQVMAGFVRQAAQIVGRELVDVTMIWSHSYHRDGPHLLLNPGTNTEVIGALHLLDYCPKTEALRTSWALDKQKPALLTWAREASAAARALGDQHIMIRGIEL